MPMDAWILGAPLKVLQQEDHPYHETTLATLGRHELGLCRKELATGPSCELFLDGRSIFLPGSAAPGRAWFEVCRELGYEPASHWDWDPALILFQQVVPALAADWHEPPWRGRHATQTLALVRGFWHVPPRNFRADGPYRCVERAWRCR